MFDAEGDDRPVKRSRYTDQLMEVKFDLKPLGKSSASSPVLKTPLMEPLAKALPTPTVRQPSRQEIAAIIAAASAAAPTPPPPAPEENETPINKATSKPHKRPQTKEEKEAKEANKEKRLLKLVGSVVVKCMSKHQKQMDTAQFKKHAKEVRVYFTFFRSSPY